MYKSIIIVFYLSVRQKNRSPQHLIKYHSLHCWMNSSLLNPLISHIIEKSLSVFLWICSDGSNRMRSFIFTTKLSLQMTLKTITKVAVSWIFMLKYLTSIILQAQIICSPPLSLIYNRKKIIKTELFHYRSWTFEFFFFF